MTTLEAGARGTVCLREMAGEECEVLSAMGLRDRCALRVCRAGEPCIVQVAATRLALSAAMARRIFVRRDAANVATSR